MRLITIAVLVAALATEGCATVINAGADFEPGVDLSQYMSFTWDEPDERPTGDPRLENNPFFADRLHMAIQVELAKRGILPGVPGPALKVHHHATVRDRVDVFEIDERAGYPPSGQPAGIQVIQFKQGTFLVDVADARTNEIIWRGWAQVDIGRALSDPEVMREQINQALKKMFEAFPLPIVQPGG